MPNKMKMQAQPMDKVLEKVMDICPSAVQNGKINFERLREELADIVDDNVRESYDFTWVGKRKAIVEANTPIRKTLRPAKDESKDWETTKNLYIEGDNLEALKLLQESYLGKVKMIYIDPPYNTGKDFIYKDNFTKSKAENDEEIGVYDDEGNKLFKNTESNGRFHSDWCSMIYPRLKLARDFLSDDGVIFISIDDNEQANLKKICDEVFGEKNFVGDCIRKTKSQTNDAKRGINYQHEYILIYSKNIDKLILKGSKKDSSNYKNPDNDTSGAWVITDPSARSGGNNSNFPIVNPYTGIVDFPPKGRYWAFAKTTFDEWVKIGKVVFRKEVKNGERGFIVKKYLSELKSEYMPLNSLFGIDNIYMNQVATKETNKLLGDMSFTYPKPLLFIKTLIESGSNHNSIILDFFSGSATTAHAVMQLNAEDGGNRKFIMVQLPEKVDKNADANNASGGGELSYYLRHWKGTYSPCWRED